MDHFPKRERTYRPFLSRMRWMNGPGRRVCHADWMVSDTAVLDQTDVRLRAVWPPVALSSEVGSQPTGVMLLGEGWVLARLNGSLQALRDRCPHRLAPLSAGCVVNDELQCGYHGWRFDQTGKCTEIPALGPGAAVPPQTATQCRVSTVLSRNDVANDEDMRESVEFEQRVLAEDLDSRPEAMHRSHFQSGPRFIRAQID